jgi:DNA-directed RNA polymerase II subunit RPB4
LRKNKFPSPYRVLAKENMAQFEVAQIANLCCEDAEEAKALIPR